MKKGGNMNDVEYYLQFLEPFPSVEEFLYLIPNALKNNEQFVIELINSGDYFFDAYQILEAIDKNLIDKKWLDNENVVLEIIKNYEDIGLTYASDRLKSDKEFILKAIEIDHWAFEYIDSKLQNDKNFVLEAVKRNAFVLLAADKKFCNDDEIVLAAVKQDGKVLEYVDERFKRNKNIVLEAIKSSPEAIFFVDEKLKKDADVIKTLVKSHPKLPKKILKAVGIEKSFF